MVHELIGMHNNRVKLGNDAKDEQKNLILSSHHDEFYSKVCMIHCSYMYMTDCVISHRIILY